MDEKIWYYTKGDGEKYGPFADEELVNLIQKGILTGEDYIWMVDLKEWLMIGNTIYSFYLKQDEEEQTATSMTVEIPLQK